MTEEPSTPDQDSGEEAEPADAPAAESNDQPQPRRQRSVLRTGCVVALVLLFIASIGVWMYRGRIITHLALWIIDDGAKAWTSADSTQGFAMHVVGHMVSRNPGTGMMGLQRKAATWLQNSNEPAIDEVLIRALKADDPRLCVLWISLDRASLAYRPDLFSTLEEQLLGHPKHKSFENDTGPLGIMAHVVTSGVAYDTSRTEQELSDFLMRKDLDPEERYEALELKAMLGHKEAVEPALCALSELGTHPNDCFLSRDGFTFRRRVAYAGRLLSEEEIKEHYDSLIQWWREHEDEWEWDPDLRKYMHIQEESESEPDRKTPPQQSP